MHIKSLWHRKKGRDELALKAVTYFLRIKMSLQRVGARQKQTVVAVFPETTAGNKAFGMLEAAAADLKSTVVERIPFERLDFGATDVLDKFYSANVVVVDVTERSYQATMFYQLGLRESFDMKHNVVTCVDQQSAFTGRRGSVNPDALSSSSAIGVSCIVVACLFIQLVLTVQSCIHLCLL